MKKVWMLYIDKFDHYQSENYRSVLLFKSEKNAKQFMMNEAKKNKVKLSESNWCYRVGFITYAGHAENNDIYSYDLGQQDVM